VIRCGRSGRRCPPAFLSQVFIRLLKSGLRHQSLTGVACCVWRQGRGVAWYAAAGAGRGEEMLDLVLELGAWPEAEALDYALLKRRKQVNGRHGGRVGRMRLLLMVITVVMA
jgi:hypothetical protein